MRTFPLFFLIVLLYGCQNSAEHSTKTHKKDKDFLIRVPQHDYELGEPFGFINTNGDTVVAMGKYQHTLGDTITTFGIVYDKNKWLGIDTKGQMLFEIFEYDNGADYLQEGYFRVIQGGKIGYANEQGKIKIPCQFECAYPFEKGKAKVANNCTEKTEGEHSLWESEEWVYIDKEGKVVE